MRLLDLLGRPRYSYYQRLALIQNRVSVIAYRAVHLATPCPVETRSGPSEENLEPFTVAAISGYARAADPLNFLLVDRAGIEPASRTHFASLHTAILLFTLLLAQGPQYAHNLVL